MGETGYALITVAASIAALLGLILRVRMPAFLALLLVSAGFGIVYGMAPGAIIRSIQSGMGGTLGFVGGAVEIVAFDEGGGRGAQRARGRGWSCRCRRRPRR